MKAAGIPLSVAFEVATGIAFAQSASDPLVNLRACSLMERVERLACLDRLSRDIAPATGTALDGRNWIISETTSPVDYTPIVAARSASRGGPNSSSMELSIHCRAGRTELVVTGPATSRVGEEYTISYRINEDRPVQFLAGSSTFGAGAAFRGDVVHFLLSLPEKGGIAVRLSTRGGAAHDGYFSLDGLKIVRDKIAAACKWPRAVAKPRN